VTSESQSTNQNNGWAQAMESFQPLAKPIEIGPLTIGDGSLTIIAGPCAIETEDICLRVADHVANVCAKLGLPYIFKSSFDKANRTSTKSFRGHGMENGLSVLRNVKERYGMPLLTDVHETGQVKAVADAVDVLQIPAFLCRQTDLLVECGKLAKAVNIKKGQFLSPQDIQYGIEKITESGNHNVFVTERGTLLGYRDLVVDMRSLVIMRNFGYPVVFDATHSVQQMGAMGGVSGGLTEFIPAQVRGAVAVGIDALFIETHPDPEHALSDGSTMVPMDQIGALLEMALAWHPTGGKKAK